MSSFVPIIKAAKIAGMSVHEFQGLLRDNDLSPVRGMVHLDDLQQICPQVDAEDTDMVEWVEHLKVHVKEHPEHKQIERLSRAELMHELSSVYREVTFYKHRISSLESTIKETCGSLQSVKKHSSEPNRVQSLISWLEKKLHHN